MLSAVLAALMLVVSAGPADTCVTPKRLQLEPVPQLEVAVAAPEGNATLIAAVVSPSDATVLTVRHALQLNGGPQLSRVPMPGLAYLDADQLLELPWDRLVVRLEREDAPPCEALVTVAELNDSAFELEVTGPAYVAVGSEMHLIARARHPVSGDAVEAVRLELRVDGRPVATGLTGPSGTAELLLSAPPTDQETGWSLQGELRAHRGPFRDRVSLDEIVVDAEPQASLVTDRPLYRPGQTVYVRAVLLEPRGTGPAEIPVRLTLSDPEDRLIRRSDGETSRFGIVHSSWDLPEDAEHGDWTVRADVGRSESSRLTHRIEVSEYELPRLRVSAEPAPSVLLPGDVSELEIEVSTLAGEALYGATVQVQAVATAPWDWPEESGEVVWTGTTGADGRCRAAIGDLEEAREQLGRWRRWSDERFRVVATDPGSGWTAATTATVRVSDEAVHLSLEDRAGVIGEPHEVWASTFTADGEPVPCRVDLVAISEQPGSEVTASVETDRHGLGVAELSLGTDDGRYELEATAVCPDGVETTARERLWPGGDLLVGVEPTRWFVPAGEPVRVQLSSVVEAGRVVVEVLADDLLLDRQTVALQDGRADVVLAPQPDRVGLVDVQAYLHPSDVALELGEHGGWQGLQRVGIIVGGAPQLTADVAPQPVNASPGAEVELELGARINGQPAEAAFALTAVDTAYESVLAERRSPNPISWFATTSEAELRSRRVTHGFGGIRVLDLLHVDPAAVPEGYERIARYLLTDTGYLAQLGGHGRWTARSSYRLLCQRRVEEALSEPLEAAQAARLEPVSTAGLKRWLVSHGVQLDAITDPWDEPFALDLSVHQERARVRIRSAGFDREHDTDDDLLVESVRWRWFSWATTRLEPALAEAWSEVGRAWTVDDVLDRADLPETALESPAGERLELVPAVHGGTIVVCAVSPELEAAESHRHGRAWQCGRGGIVGVAEHDTFEPFAREIEAALVAWRQAGHRFPATADEAWEAIRAAGIDSGDLVDPRGEPYQIEVEASTVLRNDVRGSVGGDTGGGLTVVDAVRREVRTVRIVARDPITLRWVAVHEISSEPVEVAAVTGTQLVDPVLTGISEASGYGAVTGRVLYEGDPIPGVTVTIEAGEVVTELVTPADGGFAVRLLPQLYTISFSLPAFRALSYEISVDAGEIRELDVTMFPEQIREEIVVTGRFEALDRAGDDLGGHGATAPFSTPRIRHDLRETLLWAPEVVTGPDGRATVGCVLADNVTEWNVQAVATTMDGQVATATSPLVASLPVTVEVDLPERLTVGDRLELPVVVRNLTEAPTEVVVEGRPSGGLTLVDGAQPGAPVSVVPATASKVVLPIRAVAAGDGSVTATARSEAGDDGIERTTRIVPPGQEIHEVASGILREHAELALDVPEDVVAGTATARLKVYPGLGAHLLEGLAGIDGRPIGCAEQLTSAAWLSLLILDLAEGSESVDPKAVRTSRARVVDAVRQLDRLTGRDGGVAFWRGGKPSVALTAHVCRFLVRAEPYADQARAALTRHVAWLVDTQRADGSFQSRFGGSRRSVTLTASILRALSEVAAADSRLGLQAEPALEAGMAWLGDWVETVDEPLALALWVAVLREAGRADDAAEVERRLLALARSEAGTVYWHSRFNTPLLGWGLPGRIETTAEVTRVLQASDDQEHRQLADLGVLFLLRHKDPHGVWYTTPASLAAFAAMVAAAGVPTGASGEVAVSLNGERIGALDLPAGDQASPPVVLEVEGLNPGLNRVELERTSGGGRAVVELVATWYEPWDEPASSASSEDLALSVQLDRERVGVGEPVTCTVTARRGGFRGYGMMLARVGLPPGAEVDRTSLPKLGLLTEVHPGEVVLYMWQDETVELVLRPRIAGTVVTGPSSLTDYYNPDTRVVVPPTKLIIDSP